MRNRMLLLFTALAISACSSTATSITAITALPSPAASTDTPPVIEPTAAEPSATLSMGQQLQMFAQLTATANAGAPPAATPTPWDNNLEAGRARDIAFAGDVAFQPTPRGERIAFDESPVAITFDEFYDGFNMRTGLLLSDKLVSLDGQRVVMEGYMAPPLKPELDFFVLTRIRLSFCPFCTTGSDWPDDIALIYMNNDTTTVTLNPVRVTGQMEIGMSVDQETGMVSLVRIYVDQLEILG